MSEKRKWRRITIEYDDGCAEQLDRSVIDRIAMALPMLEALNEAKSLRDRLNRTLGDDSR